MSNELPKVPETDAERLFSKLTQESPVPKEQLEQIPEQYRKFFTMALSAQSRKTSETGKMDLTKNARPEELEFLKKANIPLNEVPEDLATSLKSFGYHLDEESQVEAMRNKKPLDISTIKEVEFDKADAKTKREVLEMLEKYKATQGVPIIDTGKLPPPSASQTPAETVTAQPAANSQQFFSNLRNPEKAKPAPATAAPVTPPVEQQTIQQPSATIAPVSLICKCCNWDNQKEYPVNPDKEDIQNRIISIASTTQGGDGRFRKTYRLFGGQLEIGMREILSSEGRTIYLCEQGKVTGNDQSEEAQFGRLFSLDRIQSRRFCCGVERIARPGFAVTIPPLAEWVKNNAGNADKALDEMENYIRDIGFISESNWLAAVQKWIEFESLVIKLWRDQSFYSGNL